jgi:hypothetical protein
MSATTTVRNILIQQLRLLLGDQMVDVELDIDHYNLAVTIAVERLRQRSDGSLQEKDLFIQLQPDETVYTLPIDVQTVWRVHRRSIGVAVGGDGVNFDPFEASFANYYLLQGSQTGGLATWEVFSQYKETLSRIFASQINFTWNGDRHELILINRPEGQETVMVTVHAKKTEDDLILNPYTGPWVRDYALAKCKYMLGEARAKFPSGFAGPNGSVMLNGAELKQEALAEFERLETEIQTFVVSNRGMPFVIG